jgi:acyl-CoA thioester hydrolase
MNKVFENKLRVRYGETDQMGFVYYGNYALYLEVARTELIRSTGLSYKEMEERGIQLPVVNLNVNYRKPACYDDLITIQTKIVGKIGRKVCFSSELFNEQGDLLVKAEVELIGVNSKTKAIMSCPDDIKEKLSLYQWI